MSDPAPSTDGIAGEVEARRVPDRSEIRSLLEKYFDGPITDAHVERIVATLQEILASRSRREAEDRTYYANSVRNRGQAWKEELSRGRMMPRVIDYVPWLAATGEDFPAPNLYFRRSSLEFGAGHPAAHGIWQRIRRFAPMNASSMIASAGAHPAAPSISTTKTRTTTSSRFTR